jgi:hypothetical protein
MRARGAFVVVASILLSAGFAQTVGAQTFVEQSAEVRMQLDLAVPKEALQKLLPPGWEPAVATAGPAKDCNVRMIFVDRIDINARTARQKAPTSSSISPRRSRRPAAKWPARW